MTDHFSSFQERLLKYSASLSDPDNLGPLDRPVFIVGCGRSGTSILGETLGSHAQITYLHEPRKLWRSCFPETDIWTRLAAERGGRLVLGKEDADSTGSRRIRSLFRLATLQTGRPFLLEKTPINSFRLPFLKRVFPDSRFIHIVRAGFDVASSIAKLVPEGWFGYQDYKWIQLVAYAKTQRFAAELRDLDFDRLSADERGLVEWRLSVETARAFFGTIPGGTSCEISFHEFVSAPKDVANRLLGFMGLQEDEGLHEFVSKNIIKRKASREVPPRPTAVAKVIGGPLLRNSGL